MGEGGKDRLESEWPLCAVPYVDMPHPYVPHHTDDLSHKGQVYLLHPVHNKVALVTARLVCFTV